MRLNQTCHVACCLERVRRVVGTFLLMWMIIGRSPGVAVQAPGSGWMVAPSPERAVKTLYWQLFDTTEVWTRVVPLDTTGSKLPLSFVISATAKGKSFNEAPPYVTVLAQPDPRAFLPYDSFSLLMITTNGDRFDFVRNGAASRLGAFCDGCSLTAIVARVDSAVFHRLSTSRTISGSVLGLSFFLGLDDTTALAEFARRVRILN